MLDFFGYHVRAWRLVPASADFDISRSIVARIRAQIFERDSLEMQQVRWAQLEFPLGIGKVLNHFRNSVELANAVTGLYLRLFVRIGDDLSFERLAVADLIVVRHLRSFRMTRGFSLGFAKRVGGAINHFACNTRIFDFCIAVGEAPPLLFLLLCGKDNFLSGFKQDLQMFGHGFASASLEGQYHNKP